MDKDLKDAIQSTIFGLSVQLENKMVEDVHRCLTLLLRGLISKDEAHMEVLRLGVLIGRDIERRDIAIKAIAALSSEA